MIRNIIIESNDIIPKKMLNDTGELKVMIATLMLLMEIRNMKNACK